MKKSILISILFILLIVGCTTKNEQKVVNIIDLKEKEYDIQENQLFDELVDVPSNSIDLNSVLDNRLLGSVVDKSVDKLTFETQLLFSIEYDKFTRYEFSKEIRVIDFIILDQQLYYLTYYQEGNTYAELYKYVDGNEDIKIGKMECEDFYDPPVIVKYNDGFVVVNESSSNLEIYNFANDTFTNLFTSVVYEGNVVASLSQIQSDILYVLLAKEEGNTILSFNLQSKKSNDYPTQLKFGRYCITDDYIIIYDEDNKKELMYDKNLEMLWESPLESSSVRWVTYAKGNTVIYTTLENDMYIRNYDSDIAYKIVASNEQVLKKMPVKFLVQGNRIISSSMEASNALIYIEIRDDIFSYF